MERELPLEDILDMDTGMLRGWAGYSGFSFEERNVIIYFKDDKYEELEPSYVNMRYQGNIKKDEIYQTGETIADVLEKINRDPEEIEKVEIEIKIVERNVKKFEDVITLYPI